MGELLDRNFQLHILTELAQDYPQDSDIQLTFDSGEGNQLHVNLAYLDEHGLIQCKSYPVLGNPHPLPTSAKITAAGLDFLADDGGISAILGVVTVRFDDNTLKKLLVKRIEDETEDKELKNEMLEIVKSMPIEALKKISDKALDYGIASAPALLKSITDQM